MKELFDSGLGFKVTLAAMAMSFAGLAQADLITANLSDFTNPAAGSFFAQVEIEDTAPNTVSISVDISDPINVGLSQGDVLGLWFDVNDASILPGLSAAFSAAGFGGVFQNGNPMGIITAAEASENNVGSLGGNVNLNGGAGAGLNFDIGIGLGANGGPAGFNQTISFDLVFAGIDTSVFLNERVGLRVQSINSPTFASGSSKLLGSTTPSPPVAVPAPAPLALIGIGLLGLGLRKKFS